MSGTGRWLVPLAVSAAGFAEVAAAEEPWTGLLAEMCAACHGETGRSQGSVPDIVELDQEAMQAFLIGFRDGDMEATVMDRFARALSDSDIEALSRALAENREMLLSLPDREHDSQ